MSTSVTNDEVIVPLRLGMISDPPTLILVYEVFTTIGLEDLKKRRKRKMPLRNFSDKSDVSKFIVMLQQRHSKVISPIPQALLEKVLKIIQQVQKGCNVDDAVRIIDKEFDLNRDKDVKNIASDKFQPTMELMNISFNKNRQPNPGYIYAKEEEFESDPGSKDSEDDERDSRPHKSIDNNDSRKFSIPTQAESKGNGDTGMGAHIRSKATERLHSSQSEPGSKNSEDDERDSPSHKSISSDSRKVSIRTQAESKRSRDTDMGAHIRSKATERLHSSQSEPGSKDSEDDEKDSYSHKLIDSDSRKVSIRTQAESKGSGDTDMGAHIRSKATERLYSSHSEPVSESEKEKPIIQDKGKEKENKSTEKDPDASIESEDFDSEEEEVPVYKKDLSKTYDFKLKQDNNDDDDIDNADFWKF